MSTTLIISLEELRIYGSQWLIQRSLNEMEGFNGYWYTDDNGDRRHTFDFEESIGE